MNYRTSIFVCLMLIPLVSLEAATVRAVKKPTRGNYESVSDQKSTRLRQFSSTSSKATLKTYKGKASGFTFKYPSDWKVEDAFGKSKGFVMTPVYNDYTLKGKRDTVIAMGIRAMPNKREMSLKDIDTYIMTHSTLSNQETLGDWYIPSFNLEESSDAQIFGQPGRKYVFTGERSSVKYHMIEYVVFMKGELYILSVRSLPEFAKDDVLVFEEMVKTLKKKEVSSSSSSARSRIRTKR